MDMLCNLSCHQHTFYDIMEERVTKACIRPQDCGQRPLLLKNEVNTFRTADQAVCRETAFIK